MAVTHDALEWFSQSFGLFYLIVLSLAVVAYVYWPSNRKRFDRAADSILDDEGAAEALARAEKAPADWALVMCPQDGKPAPAPAN